MRVSLAPAILLFAAAAPAVVWAQKVDIEFDEAARFPDYKTFMIRDGQLNAKAPALQGDLVRKKIENQIRKSLTAKGLTEVTSQPDLNVFYTLGAGRRNEVETYPAGWRGLARRRVQVQYTEGTLILNLRDASRRELVWRAIAVEEKRTPVQVEDRLDEMVKKSIDKYPPRKK